jgi:hypothetical protein
MLDARRSLRMASPLRGGLPPRGGMPDAVILSRRAALSLLAALPLTSRLALAGASAPSSGSTTGRVPSASPAVAADLAAWLASPRPARPRDNANTLLLDIVYPDVFQGRWQVSSTLTSVIAPAGEQFFGPAGAFHAAQKLVGGAPLEYEARFVRSAGTAGGVIADRAFNVARIAAAAMGQSSVLECSADGINFVGATLRPSGGDGDIFAVVMSTLFRASSVAPSITGGASTMYASELVRQTVRLDGDTGSSLRAPRSQSKDIATVCAYHFGSDPDVLTAVQRTATYLPRTDPRVMDTRGAAVDLRTYSVVYTRSGVGKA